MNYLAKGAFLGIATAVVCLAVYWLTGILHSERAAVAAAITISAILAALWEIAWKRYQDEKIK